MIYVKVTGVEGSGRTTGGWKWYATEDVGEAVACALEGFEQMWAAFDHEPCVTQHITVATEESPRRTGSGRSGRRGRPLPVET